MISVIKAMKPGVSSLNPYAASYIPLAMRETNANVTVKDIKHGSDKAWFEPSSHSAQDPCYSSASLDSDNHRIARGAAVKNHPACGSFTQNPGVVDEEFDMDLEYLRMMFPGLSNESILDIYIANDGDFEAVVDMLNQLEMHTVESAETLPDTLDIGDVSESGSSATCGALKLKNMAGETSASSSGAAESAIAS